MKSFFNHALCAAVLFLANSAVLSAQYEAAPVQTNTANARIENPTTQALWDIEFGHNITVQSSSTGTAGICFLNNEFWCAKWASDTILRFNAAGVFLNKFFIPGLTGVRSFTTDGTYIYASTNTTTIYRIDPATATLAPPHITSAPPVAVRWATYDATLNTNAGGFWVGNFSTDIYSIDMNGNQLSAIPAATHGLLAMYGATIDNYTAGGPYLWVFDQSGPNTTTLYAISIATGMQITNHDVFADFAPSFGLTSGLAGGAFLTNQYTPGEVTLMGVIQGTPNNGFFGYEVQQPFPPVPDNDFEIVRTYPMQGYTQIPQLHTFAESFVVEYVNNSISAIDTVNLSFSINNTAGQQFAQTHQLLNIPAGATGSFLTQTYTPSAIDTYTATVTAQTSVAMQDSMPANNIASFNYAVTDSVFARDNNVPEISGQSISPFSWGYYAANYELQSQDIVSGIWIRLTFPVAGDTTYAIIANTASSVPLSLNATGSVVIIDTANWIFLPFPGGVTLGAGMYTFGCYEEVDGLLGLSVAASQYTSWANYIYEPSVGWFQLGTPHAYFIHPTFQSSMMSTGGNNEPTISVFPNPVTDAVSVYVGNTAQKTITLTDVNGKVVSVTTTSAQNITVPVTALANGTYVLTVTCEGKSWSENIIKQ